MTHKKMFQFFTLAVFVAVVLTVPLNAANGCQKKDGSGMMMGKCCMMLSNIINLSIEQKDKLEKLQMEHQKMMITIRAEMQKQGLEMKALMKNPVDVKKIEAKIDELNKMHADMQKKCLNHHLSVRTFLSDEQKAKFDEMNCGMMGGIGGMGCMGGCQMHRKCNLMKHKMEMKHGKCSQASE